MCVEAAGPEDLATVQVVPATWSPTALGDTTRFIAVGKTARGTTIPSLHVSWSTDGSGVVAVNADGVAIAARDGSGQVRATIGGFIGIGNVHVVQTIESVVILTYFGNVVAVGDSIRLYVDALDRNLNSVPGTIFTLQSLDQAQATVTLDGWIKGLSAGEAHIVAMAAGKADTATFQVMP